MTSKRERFVRLAENRVTKAMKHIRLIGNLSNKNNYEYSDKDIAKIVSALENEVKSVKAKFSSGDEKNGPIFKL